MLIEYRYELIFENEINDFYNNKNVEYYNEIIIENELYEFYDINNLIKLFTIMKLN